MSRYNSSRRSRMSSRIIALILLALVVVIGTTSNVVTAFVTQPQGKCQPSPMMKSIKIATTTIATTTTTTLHERQWNFNEGQGPFGLKKNAETWNGRVAQVGIRNE